MTARHPRLALSLLLLALGSPLAAQDAICVSYPPGAAEHRCTCPPGPYRGAVWGSGPYTADSDLCTAARHAGVIPEQGGPLTATSVPPPAAFAGTVSNGVTSQPWGPFDAAFVFQGAPEGVGQLACDRLDPTTIATTCLCQPGRPLGPVWGSDPYTYDSDICAAALHAGAIGPEGGEVTARRVAGQQSYAGGTANGVTTLDYPAWPRSFSFAPKD